MEETDFEVTNNDILIFIKLICLLRYKLLCSSDIFLVGYLPIIHPTFYKSVSIRGYLLQYVGIRGVFEQNPKKGGIAYYPAGHTAYRTGVKHQKINKCFFL